jgi:methylmalonyl-CoA mutase, C-terminal domain
MGVPAVVAALEGRKAVMAKVGMDAHWRGAIVVSNALRDAGMEVVYLGHATAAQLASAVAQEDAALVGLSTLSGNHVTECTAVLEALSEAGIDDVAVVVGGSIPPQDHDTLKALGVDQVFPTGSPLAHIIASIADLLA